MKSQYYLCVVWLCAAFWSQAQTNSEVVSVYFQSDQHNLDGKSKKILAELSEKLLSYSDFDLSIEAFTDDQGESDYNVALAERRANSVNVFLKEKNIEPNNLNINALGEIDEGGNSAEIRQQNRRVDIKVTTYQFQAIQDLTEYLSTKSTQRFDWQDTQNEATFVGQNGVNVTIQPNSFAFEDGTLPNGKVDIQLTEALLPSDWLKNDLGTMSDDQILQTGGMARIEATSEGRKLILTKGKTIKVAVPTTKIDSAMQLFYGQHNGAGQAVNWKLASNISTKNNTNTNSNQYLDNRKMQLPAIEVLSKLRSMRLPKIASVPRPKLAKLSNLLMPIRPIQVSIPVLKTVAMPDLTTVADLKKQQLLKEKYDEECQNAKERFVKDSLNIVKFWANYRRDSLAYFAETAKVNNNNLLINKYLEAKYYNLNIKRLSLFLKRSDAAWAGKDYKIEYHTGGTVFNSIHEFVNESLKDKTFRNSVLKGLVHEQFGTRSFDYDAFKKSKYTSWDSLNRSLGLRDSCFTEERAFKDALANKLKEGDNRYMEQYVFSMTQTGWANCDRFAQFTQTRYPVEIEEKDSNVKIYLLCKEINCFIPCSKSEKGYTSPPIPKGTKATLVAIKLENGKAMYAQSTQTIDYQNKIKPDYKRLTMKELESAMTGLN
jgi:OmpA family